MISPSLAGLEFAPLYPANLWLFEAMAPAVVTDAGLRAYREFAKTVEHGVS